MPGVAAGRPVNLVLLGDMNPRERDALPLIAYRLRAVAVGHLALTYTLSWDVVPAIRVFFDDKEVMDGAASGFTSPVIEAALIHCRALLEFLGLRSAGVAGLASRAGSKSDDVVIEDHPVLLHDRFERVTEALLFLNTVLHFLTGHVPVLGQDWFEQGGIHAVTEVGFDDDVIDFELECLGSELSEHMFFVAALESLASQDVQVAVEHPQDRVARFVFASTSRVYRHDDASVR